MFFPCDGQHVIGSRQTLARWIGGIVCEYRVLQNLPDELLDDVRKTNVERLRSLMYIL